jgi:hypothetical protein
MTDELSKVAMMPTALSDVIVDSGSDPPRTLQRLS